MLEILVGVYLGVTALCFLYAANWYWSRGQSMAAIPITVWFWPLAVPVVVIIYGVKLLASLDEVRRRGF